MSSPARRGPDRGTSAGPDLVLVNGAPAVALANPEVGAHTISPLDRGLHYGDGLFETIACRAGRVRFLDLHLERLTRSCERLRIDPGPVSTIREELQNAAAEARNCLIKLLITRGEALARGYAWSGRETATRVLFRYPWSGEDTRPQREGVRVRIAQLRLGENPALAGMKHLNRLEQVLARSEVPAAEAAELLLFSRSGYLICGTMTNVFIVRQGRLETPRLDTCGVEGVMRRVVMREAQSEGLPVAETTLNSSDVDGAEEMFLTNARIGIWPVCMIGARALAPGPVTRRLQERLAPKLENPVDA
jgi:4-amino-4-deoxychorismate lyase